MTGLVLSMMLLAIPDEGQLAQMQARFKPTTMAVDLTKLSEGDRRALAKVIAAARILDDLFLEQVWSGNRALMGQLAEDKSGLGQERFRYFWLNKGPWSGIDGHEAFMPGVPSHKPEAANFYPEGTTREEIETWIKGLSLEEQEAAKGFFTVIRRDPQGGLRAVPYSKAYAEWLGPVAALLAEAAFDTDNDTLRRFLSARAAAFASNDYYASDVAWMDLDAPLEITFGPYETYNDELFGYKAAFEAFVALRDEEGTARLAALAGHLQNIEDALPVPAALRNPKLGSSSVALRVVNLVYNSGDASQGVQTAAFNLPNDERIVQERGSKRVMLKNIQQAKFNEVLRPIAEKVLSKDDRKNLSFDLFFLHIVTHELCHGLGLHSIQRDGQATSPRAELKDIYAALEEARADVLGLYALQHLMTNAKKYGLDKTLPTGAKAERELYTTFLASTFRTLRFGAKEAHAKGMAIQLNWMLDHKGVMVRKDGTFHVDMANMKKAVSSLATELITIHSTGDRARGEALLARLGVVRPEVTKALGTLTGVPTDIAPSFITAHELVANAGAPGPLQRAPAIR